MCWCSSPTLPPHRGQTEGSPRQSPGLTWSWSLLLAPNLVLGNMYNPRASYCGCHCHAPQLPNKGELAQPPPPALHNTSPPLLCKPTGAPKASEAELLLHTPQPWSPHPSTGFSLDLDPGGRGVGCGVQSAIFQIRVHRGEEVCKVTWGSWPSFDRHPLSCL